MLHLVACGCCPWATGSEVQHGEATACLPLRQQHGWATWLSSNNCKDMQAPSNAQTLAATTRPKHTHNSFFKNHSKLNQAPRCQKPKPPHGAAKLSPVWSCGWSLGPLSFPLSQSFCQGLHWLEARWPLELARCDVEAAVRPLLTLAFLHGQQGQDLLTSAADAVLINVVIATGIGGTGSCPSAGPCGNGAGGSGSRCCGSRSCGSCGWKSCCGSGSSGSISWPLLSWSKSCLSQWPETWPRVPKSCIHNCCLLWKPGPAWGRSLNESHRLANLAFQASTSTTWILAMPSWSMILNPLSRKMEALAASMGVLPWWSSVDLTLPSTLRPVKNSMLSWNTKWDLSLLAVSICLLIVLWLPGQPKLTEPLRFLMILW